MDPLEELNKASRSVRISIQNLTNKKLVLKSHPISSGQWRVSPPEHILPLSIVEFGSESGMIGGTEAGSIYVIEGSKVSDGQFEFFWNNPMFGRKEFRRVAPGGFKSEYTSNNAHNCVLKCIVKELDTGTKEVDDIENEIRNLANYINEAEGAIKGMTKMAQVYQMQKDEKQVKLVENNLRDKTKHLEDMKVRKQELEQEIHRLHSLDTDPKALEQVLSKIRDSIESLVKQRKGMEYMREVYERSKDTKSMEGLDKQVEVKKNEIDLLRKKEQKVIQKIIEIKKSLGLGATGVQTKKKVVALFDYQKSTDDELSIKAGDIIDIIHDEDPDWYGGKLNGQMGYFPKAFVGPLEQANSGQGSAASAPEGQSDSETYTGEDFSHLYPKARVVYDHDPADEGEIELRVGDIVTVYSWDNEYWWEGVSVAGKTGYFPNTCVDWIEPENTDNEDYSNYSYYESTDNSNNEDQNKNNNTTNPTPVVTPAATIQPPPTVFTPPNLNKQLNSNHTTASPKRELPLPVTPSATAKAAPTVTPIGSNKLNTPATHTPVTHTPATHTPATHTPVHSKPLPSVNENKPVPPTPTQSSAPSAINPTPAPTTPTPATSTPAVPTSKPIVSSAATLSSASSQFDKILQPIITDFTKKLVEAHQKETQALNQRIAALEKELKELKESGKTSVTSTATVVSKATPSVRKF
ncbi:hypothetical protein DICPUDRAFT_84454 [Dictyostelium purpureum]|uniref:SH3 domain-containing protein n=1 Tax=Dictyostelium purpureum TaxID=5786 RepID=F1A2P8_DICPU|nr:uncharacterized protein DICPUDRAFT_84454 [Dictyostelium purpureum]EGC29536.1 hypothetical protein DICPUDRAFT_84454 [Dictyostelium purpureum]|eukprot:XP_003293944.1 hypothetical protein DICPUDRAFT_84454 [Dictyostelium purpureum]